MPTMVHLLNCPSGSNSLLTAVPEGTMQGKDHPISSISSHLDEASRDPKMKGNCSSLTGSFVAAHGTHKCITAEETSQLPSCTSQLLFIAFKKRHQINSNKSHQLDKLPHSAMLGPQKGQTTEALELPLLALRWPFRVPGTDQEDPAAQGATQTQALCLPQRASSQPKDKGQVNGGAPRVHQTLNYLTHLS